MRKLMSTVLLLVGVTIIALPPQLDNVRGFLDKVEGPLKNFTNTLAIIPIIQPNSVLLKPIIEDNGNFYRADYLFDGQTVFVLSFEDSVGEFYPWQTQSRLCSGRDLLLMNDRGLLAVGLTEGGKGFIILLRDAEVDICSFLNIFLPLMAFFDDGGGGSSQFPAALGSLP